jgi:hypothetical protein
MKGSLATSPMNRLLRNADSLPVNAHSNAARQKRYRDRKRGGPPVGRWNGHVSMAMRAKAVGVSRTMLFMAGWIRRNAGSEIVADIKAGKLPLAATYRRLRREAEENANRHDQR